MVAVVVVVVVFSTISDCTEILQCLSENNMFHVITLGHHHINLTFTAKLLYKF
jgi:hypothetical protein